ncbi:MAG TPA: hypothetical protein VEI97_17450 [bacterium]|nr:hypothetical protein [bacterium]
MTTASGVFKPPPPSAPARRWNLPRALAWIGGSLAIGALVIPLLGDTYARVEGERRARAVEAQAKESAARAAWRTPIRPEVPRAPLRDPADPAVVRQVAGATLVAGVGTMVLQWRDLTGSPEPEGALDYLHSPALFYWPLDMKGEPWPIVQQIRVEGDTGEVGLKRGYRQPETSEIEPEPTRLLTAAVPFTSRTPTSVLSSWALADLWPLFTRNPRRPLKLQDFPTRERLALVVIAPLRFVTQELNVPGKQELMLPDPAAVGFVREAWEPWLGRITELRAYVVSRVPGYTVDRRVFVWSAVVDGTEVFPLDNPGRENLKRVWRLRLDDPQLRWISRDDIEGGGDPPG